MTWVVAAAFPILGILIADVRVSVQTSGGGYQPLTTVGLRKIRVFSDVTVAGFSGDISHAWHSLDLLEAYFRDHDEDGPQLRAQLEDWLGKDEAVLSEGLEMSGRTELLILRMFASYLNEENWIPMAIGCHVRLPDSDQSRASVRQFSGVEHIGSGSEVPAYVEAVEKAQTETIGLANMHIAMTKQTEGWWDSGLMSRLIAHAWAGVVATSPIPSVSLDIETCVLSDREPQGATLQHLGTQEAPHPQIHIARSSWKL